MPKVSVAANKSATTTLTFYTSKATAIRPVRYAAGRSATSSNPNDVAKGSCLLTSDGADTPNSSTAASTTVTLTLQLRAVLLYAGHATQPRFGRVRSSFETRHRMTRPITMRIVGLQQPNSVADRAEDFSSLAELHMPIIYRFLLASVKDRDLAETLTQECFLKAYRNRLSFRGESSVKTWLMRIAINLQRDHWRNRRMRFWRETQANAVDVDSASDQLLSAGRSPEVEVIAREQAAQIWRIVESLSKRERSVFLLRYGDELELKEIGSCTGLKVGAVKVYLARALAKIRATLREGEYR